MTDPEVPEIVECPARRTRRRSPKSCEQCRKRKLRCDRGLPCRPCKRSRGALQCSYSPNTTRDAASSSEAPRRASQYASNSEGQADVAIVLDSLKFGREQFHSAGYHPPGAGDQAKNNNANNSSSDLFPRPQIRVGTLETDKTRLFGRAHWVHALAQFNLIEKLQFLGPTALNGLQEGMASLCREVASRRSSLKHHRTLELNEPLPGLAGTLPPKATCDQLLSNYWRFFEPIFRVLHRDAFDEEYDSYWAGSTKPSTGFILKLSMVLGLGAVVHQDLAESGRIRGLAKSWLYAVQWWLMGPMEKTARCLDGVQTFCLAVLLRQASSLGGATSISTDSMMKLAMSMGLHLDPDGFSVYGPFERELRRRIWHTVLELTVMTSLDTTLPLLITPDDYNCRPPLNLSDAKFGPNSEEMPQARSSVSGFTDSSTQLLLQKSLVRRLYAVRRMNGIQKPLSYEETIELGKELKMQCRDIASFFYSRMSGTEDCDDRDACEFHRKFLDSYLRRYILFLHRPFGIQARKDPRYHLARKTCLECCQIVSSHAAGLILPQKVTDEFCLMAIRGSGLFKGPLSQDVVIHLGLEVVTQLEEERGLRIPGEPATPTSCADPLIQMSQAGRQPLIDTLRHILGQLRQIIALGQPSCKRYLLLSAAMVHIKELEAGSSNPLPAALSQLTECLQDCSELLRLASADYSQPVTDSDPAWSDEVSPDWSDTLGLFGFDFDLLVG
ncbi:C6 zinc finger domain protein [Apiospora aurea]|uniref:C6 zinc finger domain protein n=1 Tax=Apiospora aurea TaxID=335848 RepID=A0ABR1QWT8_9PEZI